MTTPFMALQGKLIISTKPVFPTKLVTNAWLLTGDLEEMAQCGRDGDGCYCNGHDKGGSHSMPCSLSH
eukprot:14512506-Ditylum_brightwellii.AAC.1